jgi:bifunctional DNA-binding transcriptional regulator/antitoxin component of YhaV-PrlF toxin-antitoxin module
MGEKSIIAKASSKSPSIRTTIPEKIVKEMKLNVGDVLDWSIDTQNDRKIMKIKKLE